MAELDNILTSLCDTELAAVGRSSEGCPYLAYWLAHYRTQPAARIERTIALWAGGGGETGGAASAERLMTAVVSRVRGAVRQWVATGDPGPLPEAVPEVDATSGAPAAVQPHALQRHTADLSRRLGTGHPVDTRTRAVAEPAFGQSLGDVRVHSEAGATAMARERDLMAFTVGRDVVVDDDAYRPGTVAGDILLAHELAHVVQQSGAEPATPRPTGWHDQEAEVEADTAAVDAVLGRPATVTSGRGLRLQGCSHKTKACPKGRSWYPTQTLQWGSFGCTCLWKCVTTPPTARGGGGYSGPAVSCPPGVYCGDPYDRVDEDYSKTGYGAAFTPLTGAPACGCFALDIEGGEQTEAPLVPVSVDMTTVVGPTADMAAGAAARRRGGGGGGPKTDPTTGTRIPGHEPQLANPLRTRAIEEGLYTTGLARRLDTVFRESDPAVMQALRRTLDDFSGSTRTERVTRLLDWAERRPSRPGTIEEGAVFGKGGTGSVAEVVGRPDLASKTGAGRAGSEAAAMVELELAGIPTVYVAEGRTASGATRLVLRRIDGVGSKEIIGRPGRPPDDPVAAKTNESLVTARTIEDLQRIRARLVDARLNIGDFQFIVSRSDGSVFVNDPTGVTPNSKPSGDIDNIIDRFTAIHRRRTAGGTTP